MGLVQQVLEVVKKRNPNEPEFLQAVTEVLESIRPVIERHKKYRDGKILERLVEPERMIQFRVQRGVPGFFRLCISCAVRWLAGSSSRSQPG